MNSNNTTVIMTKEYNVILACVTLAKEKASSIIWMKNGTEIIKPVRV